jgi:hypothetical protein
MFLAQPVKNPAPCTNEKELYNPFHPSIMYKNNNGTNKNIKSTNYAEYHLNQ